MKDFATYYKHQFQQDLLNFIAHIPIEGNKHYNKENFSIQYFFLTPNYNFLDTIQQESQKLFAVALYWAVLLDQVFYSNYRNEYSVFQHNTLYPKFIGNCTAPSLMSSQCGHHQNPKQIFKAINDINDKGNLIGFEREIFIKNECLLKRKPIDFSDYLEISKETIKHEVERYFQDHHHETTWVEFWGKCLDEL